MVQELIFRGLAGAGLASLGFAVLFNVRGKTIFYAALTGGIGGFVYLYCFKVLNMQEGLANFYGAVALTVCAEILARRLKITVTTILACALIPLVPGGGAYRFMTAFMEGEIYKGLTYVLDTFTNAGMLCIGTLIVSALTRFFFYTRRKVQKVITIAKDSTRQVRAQFEQSRSDSRTKKRRPQEKRRLRLKKTAGSRSVEPDSRDSSGSSESFKADDQNAS